MKQKLLILTVIGVAAVSVAVLLYLRSSKETTETAQGAPSGSQPGVVTNTDLQELHTLLVDDYHSTNSQISITSAIAHELIAEQLRTNEAFLEWATNAVISTITQFVQSGSIPIYGASHLTADALKFHKVTADAPVGLHAEVVFDPNPSAEGPLAFIVEGGINPTIQLVRNGYRTESYQLDPLAWECSARRIGRMDWSCAAAPLDKGQVDELARKAFHAMTERDLGSFNVRTKIETEKFLNRNAVHTDVTATGDPNVKIFTPKDYVYPFATFKYGDANSVRVRYPVRWCKPVLGAANSSRCWQSWANQKPCMNWEKNSWDRAPGSVPCLTKSTPWTRSSVAKFTGDCLLTRMRWFRILLMAIGIGLLAVMLWFFRPSSEPSYNGHTLSEWVELRGEYRYTTNQWATEPEIEDAVHHIGGNAIPFLLRWISFEPQPGSDRSAEDKRLMFRALGTVAAFRILNSDGVSAMPHLARMAQVADDDYPKYPDPAWGIDYESPPNRRAIFALANIGPRAMPFLLTLVGNSSDKIQCDAVYLLSTMDTNALPAIPLLLQDIQFPANPVAAVAARTLGALKLEPETVVPALTGALANEKFLLNYGTNGPMDQKMVFLHEVLHSLGDYGPEARPALPAIVEWLQIDDSYAPEWAADALSNFTYEPELVVPALTKCLESPNQFLVRSAAQSLGAFGPAAKSAVPALTEVAGHTDLMRPVRFGIAKALEAITNSDSTPISEP